MISDVCHSKIDVNKHKNLIDTWIIKITELVSSPPSVCYMHYTLPENDNTLSPDTKELKTMINCVMLFWMVLLSPPPSRPHPHPHLFKRWWNVPFFNFHHRIQNKHPKLLACYIFFSMRASFVLNVGIWDFTEDCVTNSEPSKVNNFTS